MYIGKIFVTVSLDNVLCTRTVVVFPAKGHDGSSMMKDDTAVHEYSRIIIRLYGETLPFVFVYDSPKVEVDVEA